MSHSIPLYVIFSRTDTLNLYQPTKWDRDSRVPYFSAHITACNG